MYDCIVIGGGSSGLMAALAAAEHGAKVLLIEKGEKLGRKLAISGGGRCNVTNRMPVDQLIQHIPGNGRFLYSAFSIFNNEDIIFFFEKLGIRLKEEDHGRMFPATDRAQTVINGLLQKLKELDVTIKMNTPVKKVLYENHHVIGIQSFTGEIIRSKTVIISTGGKSVPKTGSTGDGYEWAKEAGHTITALYPTEVPIISEEEFIKERILQGLSLRDVNLSVLNDKGKVVISHRMDLLFTHFGISGPAALRCSQFVVKELKKKDRQNVILMLDIFPDKKEDQIYSEIYQQLLDSPKKSVKNVLKAYLPERYLLFMLNRVQLSEQLTVSQISKDQIRLLAKELKQFTFQVHGTLPLDQAFITGGGVSVKEIDPKTMASKKMNGLYFSGEILDIHGYTGGFNITAAFVTGYVAGLSAAKKITASISTTF